MQDAMVVHIFQITTYEHSFDSVYRCCKGPKEVILKWFVCFKKNLPGI